MATSHSSTHRRKDEPDDLRKLRREHGGSLNTLKELFADWTEEDLLYAIQDAGGDVELAIDRISEGHATQWGEVKGRKKTPKPKASVEKQEFRTSSSQRGGRRGGGDGFRGGFLGSPEDGTRPGRHTPARGSARGGRGGLISGDRSRRPAKTDAVSVASEATNDLSGSTWGDSTNTTTDSNAAWSAPDSNDSTAAAWGAEPTTNDVSSTDTPSTSATATITSDNSWGSTSTAHTTSASTTTSDATDSWGSSLAPTAASTASMPVRKTNTIPAGSTKSWANIVKPVEPISLPKPVAASVPISTPTPSSTTTAPEIPTSEPTVPEVEEPAVEESPDSTSVIEEKTPEEPITDISESVGGEEINEKEEKTEALASAAEPTPATEPAPAVEPASSTELAPVSETVTAIEPALKAVTPVGAPGLKPKSVSQPRRLNQDAPVVMPSGSSALQSVGVKFGSFSLNDDTEPEPKTSPTQPIQPAQPEQPTQQTASANAQTTPQPQQAQQQPQQQFQQTQQQPQQQQQPHQQPAAYGRQPNVPSGASGYQGITPAVGGLSPAATNVSYLKDPSATYLGQHHHHPMGHDAMGSPYGSYMPNPASQLGSFGMGPMASLPNDYAAIYSNDLQRAMYYDPSYGQIPVTAANNYQSRDSKYNQESTSTVSSTGAPNSGSTQAQQSLQQQQQQQQAYPSMPYYPYYYMAPNQFPNYQQSGYGQPFVNKNMYPMYQHQQQQQHTNKPGATNSSPYGNYGSTAGQGHHQYSQAGYEDMSGAGVHGMGGLNDPYAKYVNPGMQNFLSNQQQQQPGTPTSNANSTKSNASNNYGSGSDKNAIAGSQSSNAGQMASGTSLQGQPGPGNANQNQQGYYQQQMFSNYQYPSHHQSYHPNQHQGQHQGTGRNQQQFWGSQN